MKKVDSVIIFLTASFIFYLMSFLRWETGTDWAAYHTYFGDIAEWFGDSEFEWGFSRINEFVKLNFNNFTVLLLIIGLLVFSFQTTAILKFSPYPITSLLILWCVSLGNVFFVRQTVATSILFYSIIYIQKRNFWKFLCMVGLAMLFHRTSVVFIFAWWIYGLNLKSRTLFLYMMASIFLSVILSVALQSLGGLIGGIIQQKLDFYLSDSDSTLGAQASLTEIIIKGFANKIFIFGASALMLGKIEKRDPVFRNYLNIYWAGIILYFSTISISVALVRLSFAYDNIIVIIIPFIFKHINLYYWRFLMFLVVIIYLMARLYITVAGSYIDAYVPFKTIFSL